MTDADIKSIESLIIKMDLYELRLNALESELDFVSKEIQCFLTMQAEQAKTDEILKNIKKSWAARNEN